MLPHDASDCWSPDRDLDAASFPPDTDPRVIGGQILRDLALDGAFGVQGPSRDGAITVNRQDIVAPRRITYLPAVGKVTIERVEFRPSAFLSRFHHRRGYQQSFAADTILAVTIDLVVVAMD